MSLRRPDWLTAEMPTGAEYFRVKNILKKSRLSTICQEADCPNISECYSKGTATFLILGDICTRNCSYCNVSSGWPKPADPDEGRRIADVVSRLDMDYVVLTSVTRDDLDDGGARHFISVLNALRSLGKPPAVELLVPDFKGDYTAIDLVIEAGAEVLNHNIEAAGDVFERVRPRGCYKRSLGLLKRSKDAGGITKSGMMLGLGEDCDAVFKTIDDLSFIDILTIGQYMQPSKRHIKAHKFYTPHEFVEIGNYAKDAGIKRVVSAPLVRSSYRAKELWEGLNDVKDGK